MNKKLKDEMYDTIYQAAMAKGALAAQACTPIPMVVEEHASPFDDKSPVVQQWFEPNGVCGFAWVVIKPGTSSFAKWLIRNNHAKPHYYGGVQIWIGGYGQCYQKKVAHAYAMAAYLNQIKIKGVRAYAQDRLD